jgi:hypothetical protein
VSFPWSEKRFPIRTREPPKTSRSRHHGLMAHPLIQPRRRRQDI